MSRSYKKNPWVCDRNPFMKNYANRRLRRHHIDIDGADETGDYAWYKRVTCPWDICDWKWQLESTFEKYVQASDRVHQKFGLEPDSRKDLKRNWFQAIGK